MFGAFSLVALCVVLSFVLVFAVLLRLLVFVFGFIFCARYCVFPERRVFLVFIYFCACGFFFDFSFLK